MKTFGENLRNRRKMWGIKQNELADMVGVSVNSLVNYEKGYSFPSILVAAELAKALYCTIDYLVTGEEKQHERNTY